MSSFADVLVYMWIPLWGAYFGGFEEVLGWFFIDMVFLGIPIGWIIFIVGLGRHMYDIFYEHIDPVGYGLDKAYQMDRQRDKMNRQQDRAIMENKRFDKKRKYQVSKAQYTANKVNNRMKLNAYQKMSMQEKSKINIKTYFGGK